jgi:uncharacterized phage-associated protein
VADWELQLMAVSAHDVADDLRRRLPGLGVVKLHKLLYYAQGWHLTWLGEPLFREQIKAWANGPVVAKLWADEKHGRGRPQPEELRGNQIAILDYVVGRYGSFTGKDLIRLTHTEDPWRSIGESDDPGAAADPVINHEALRSWFENDEEYVEREADLARLRERTDIYGFGPLEMTPDLEAAISRAGKGERRRDVRPG